MSTRPAAPAFHEPTEQSVELLRPDRKNARNITERSFRGLNYSMSEFGDLSGIVWNEEQGELVGGHARMRALRQAGAKAWTRLSDEEGFIADLRTGERFAVRIVRWPESKHRAAQLLANNPHIQGDFTAEAAEQLKALEGEAAFGQGVLDRLLDDLAVDEKKADRRGGLEEFDVEPAPKPSWVVISAPSDIATEIESDLRGRFGDNPHVRIERRP